MAKEKGVIVAASMSAGSSAKIGGTGVSGKAVEEAMAAATRKALADGITDPAEILKLKLAAREKFKSDHRATVARAAKAEAKATKAAR